MAACCIRLEEYGEKKMISLAVIGNPLGESLAFLLSAVYNGDLRFYGCVFALLFLMAFFRQKHLSRKP